MLICCCWFYFSLKILHRYASSLWLIFPLSIDFSAEFRWFIDILHNVQHKISTFSNILMFHVHVRDVCRIGLLWFWYNKSYNLKSINCYYHNLPLKNTPFFHFETIFSSSQSIAVQNHWISIAIGATIIYTH